LVILSNTNYLASEWCQPNICSVSDSHAQIRNVSTERQNALMYNLILFMIYKLNYNIDIEHNINNNCEAYNFILLYQFKIVLFVLFFDLKDENIFL